MIDQFQTPMILSCRFLDGLRTVAPFVIGMSPVSVKKFILLNAAGALVWAAVIACGGYFFGRALEVLIGTLKSYEMYIMGSVAMVGLLIWILHFYRRRRRSTKLVAKSR